MCHTHCITASKHMAKQIHHAEQEYLYHLGNMLWALQTYVLFQSVLQETPPPSAMHISPRRSIQQWQLCKSSKQGGICAVSSALHSGVCPACTVCRHPAIKLLYPRSHLLALCTTSLRSSSPAYFKFFCPLWQIGQIVCCPKTQILHYL